MDNFKDKANKGLTREIANAKYDYDQWLNGQATKSQIENVKNFAGLE